MQISWNGLGCFTLVAKPAQSDVTVITNPFKAQADLKMKAASASLVLQSHDGKDADNISAITAEHPEESTEVFTVTHAGEYEVRGVFITGVYAPKKDGTPHTIYRIDAEGMHIGFLGALDRALTEKEIDALGNIDILLVPAGGKTVLSPTEANAVVAEIEPRVIVPSYINTDGYASLEVVKREIACATEETGKFKVTRTQLPEEDMKMVVLSL